MLTAIDQVLLASYNASLANEIPEFARHNYFLNGDAYNRPVRAYLNDREVAGDLFEFDLSTNPPTQAQEWQLFRSRLENLPGQDYFTGGVPGAPSGNAQRNAAVRTFQVLENDYPSNGPNTARYPSRVERWGSGYIEFYRPANAAAGTVLSVTVEVLVEIPVPGATQVRLSAIPIRNFAARPNPINNFLQADLTRYTFRVTNFELCNDRVALIVSSLNAKLDYSYRAELTTVLPPANPPPTLQVLACGP